MQQWARPPNVPTIMPMSPTLFSLAFSTNAYTRNPLLDALRHIRAAGFGAVEILADTPHAYPEALAPGWVHEIRSELKRLNLRVSNVNANCTFGYFRDPPPEAFFEPSLISPRPDYREDRIRMIARVLDFAREIGADNISITSGRLLGGMPPAAARRQLDESLRRVLDQADRAGVNVGIECEPGLFVEYAAELAEVIDRLDHPRLGANFDVGHAIVAGEDVPAALRLLRGRIWNLHVEDLPGRKHYHMIPGDGTVDWPALGQALRDIHYDRYATVELYTQSADPDTAARRSYDFLRRTWDSR
jgi:sugar phosphate isomerase/epimerase